MTFFLRPSVLDSMRVLRGAFYVIRAQSEYFFQTSRRGRITLNSAEKFSSHPHPSSASPPAPSTPPQGPLGHNVADHTVHELAVDGNGSNLPTPTPPSPPSPEPPTQPPQPPQPPSPLPSPSPPQPTPPGPVQPLAAEQNVLHEHTHVSTEKMTDSNESSTSTSTAHRVMRERSVPQSPLSRIAAFGALGASLVTGAAAEVTRRAIFGRGNVSSAEGITTATINDATSMVTSAAATTATTSSAAAPTISGSPFLTEANAHRLANTLSRMRGAALKLGQMLSIQDETVIPPTLAAALQRVRQNADIMPVRQLHQTLASELGEDWRARFVSFEDEPMAAASIGQVHRAVVSKNGSEEGTDVVLKVQYPGVARSIQSDVATLRRILRLGNLVPDSYYVNEALEYAEVELERECNYDIEAENQRRYRELVMNDHKLSDRFYVPHILDNLSTKRVLTSEYVHGVSIDSLSDASLGLRNRVAHDMLVLAIRELFIFGFQQSDPNWSNYLYDAVGDHINLIDFGAARSYDETFLSSYLELIRACADGDEERIIQQSIDLGFLTGEESREMLSAHVSASLAVGEPFRAQGLFNFDGCDIPKRTAQFGKVMLEYRLTPPPREAYSLHRRLSGAFLLSTKLKAAVNAREILDTTLTELKHKSKLKLV